MTCRERGCVGVAEPDRVRCAKHLAQKREYMRQYYLKNREVMLSNMARNRAKDPDAKHASDAKWRYGIDRIDYEAMLAEQGGVCAICKEPETYKRNGKTMRLAVDHCHETGLIRGLLCGRCNRALGLMRDNKKTAAGMVIYLSRAEGVRL